jgi:hypothetical protein
VVRPARRVLQPGEDRHPSQLSQWFTGPDWTTVHAGSLQLTADGAYSHLGASLGVAMAGKVASAKTGQAVDRACTAGN